MFGRMGLWALCLILLRIHSTLAGEFKINCARHPIVTAVGATVVLECQLIPIVPQADIEIRWTKGDGLVHLYRFGMDENAGQHGSYQGRTQLFASEFKSGNVSLMLTNVDVSDEGEYKCFVDIPTLGNEDAVIYLNVTSLGEPPSINLNKYTGSGILLQCESQRWFPVPTVEWSDKDSKTLPQQAQTSTKQDSKLFFKVQSFLEVTSDSGDIFTCQLRNVRLNKTVSTVFHVPVEFFPKTSGWLYVFLLILFSIFAVVGGLWWYFRKQRTQIRELKMRPSIQEYEDLLIRNRENTLKLDKFNENLDVIRLLSKTAVQRMTRVAVPITLDCDTANPNLKVSSDLTSVSYTEEGKIPADSGKRFETRLSVLGKDGFTSGRHYWEVEVGSMSAWDLGVARESVTSGEPSPLNPENGYWTIGYNGKGYMANDNDPLQISLEKKLQKIGIYVNYNTGQVLFCNAATYSHLHSFTGCFGEKIYPFFNVSKSKEALKICPPCKI
ncbi:butyrophilin subfamily 1 member A1-like [Heterodontus francisci]|uniref:butyrophilin subfamily 1 member A1-like n=1 Tax=Heterodontus francisci TaxID=7792 RepID=UPI00355B2A92